MKSNILGERISLDDLRRQGVVFCDAGSRESAHGNVSDLLSAIHDLQAADKLHVNRLDRVESFMKAADMLSVKQTALVTTTRGPTIATIHCVFDNKLNFQISLRTNVGRNWRIDLTFGMHIKTVYMSYEYHRANVDDLDRHRVLNFIRADNKLINADKRAGRPTLCCYSKF